LHISKKKKKSNYPKTHHQLTSHPSEGWLVFTKCKTTNVGKVWQHHNPHELMVSVENGTASMENSLVVLRVVIKLA
jgi:hypothetical protein